MLKMNYFFNVFIFRPQPIAAGIQYLTEVLQMHT